MERRQDVSVVRLHEVLLECHDDVSGELWQRPISTYPRSLKQASNETRNDVSVVRHQDVPSVRI